MNSLVRTKICGITNLDDAIYCAENGVSALGFIFYAESKRAVTTEKAQQIIAQLSPFITTVGLFVNPTYDEVEEVLKKVPLQMLQFHGDENAEFCASFGRPYMKAIRVKNIDDFILGEKDFASASALLYDAYSTNEYGGTGQSFNWKIIPNNLNKPWVLAGGLNPQNVRQAVSICQAKNIDVSSGVECAPGLKDHDKIKSLLAGVSK